MILKKSIHNNFHNYYENLIHERGEGLSQKRDIFPEDYNFENIIKDVCPFDSSMTETPESQTDFPQTTKTKYNGKDYLEKAKNIKPLNLNKPVYDPTHELEKDYSDQNRIRSVGKIVNDILKQSNLSPLIERRDYVPQGHDILEQNALALKEEGKLPEDIEKQLKKRISKKYIN